MMGVTAGIVAVGSAASGVAQGLLGASAAKSAADEQANALQQALQFQQQTYGQTQTNLNPFIQGGTSALGSLEGLYGLPGGNPGGATAAFNQFTQTPFYQFPLSQGEGALNASGAARGLTLSGGQANALQQYGQGYASSGFSGYINALSGLANLGQSSAATLGAQGNQAATNVTGIQTGIGNAQAAGTIGSANQINNALGQLPLLLAGAGNLSGGFGNSSSYTGPSANSLQNLSGTPGSFQNALGLSRDQLVP